MADFTPKSTVKSAVRELSAPIADYATFDAIITEIIENNPWGCTPYSSNGATIQGVVRGTERYTATITYENNEAKTVGTIPVRGPSMAAVNNAVTKILADTTITSGFGSGVSGSRDSSADTYSCTIKAHASNGELYNVTFKRDSVALSSYEADSIRTTLESWADTVAILA
jgi:hypothetical protein